jgi:hypothetical protein
MSNRRRIDFWMTKSGEFFKSLLNRNGIVHPKGFVPNADGRALFAYRCTEGEYQTLCAMAKSGVIQDLLNGKDDASYAKALLCLYAAERLRRYHGEGAFKWEDALGIKPKVLGKVHEAIKHGVERFWKLVIRSDGHTGRDQYIYTLACQGGLPLKLLQTQKVRDYFKALQGIRAKRNEPIKADQACAETQGRFLSKIWQESYVYALICDLINGISDLQEHLSAADNDPVAQLDLREPKWRDKLPINAGDAELSDLLTGLVTEMYRLKTSSSQRSGAESSTYANAVSGETIAALKVKTLLTESKVGWQLSRKIALEANYSKEQIELWLGRNTDSNRLTIVVEHPDSANTPAFDWARLTKSISTGIWTRKWLSVAEGQIRDSSLYSPLRLQIDDGECTEMPTLFGTIPERLPLLFTEVAAGKWLYRGECQLKSRTGAAETLLALPSNWVLMHASTELSVGNFKGLGLYQVTGEVLLIDAETDEERRLFCGTDDRDIAKFQLCGDLVYEDLSPIQAFRGIPKLIATDFEGRSMPLPDLLRWHPVTERGWNADCRLAFGRITINCGTAFCETINVLPPGFGLKPQIVKGAEQPGFYRFSNTYAAKIDSACESVTIEPDALVCEERKEPSPIEVQFSWANPARAVTLTLAYPQQSAKFWLDERCVTDTDLVPASRLTGLSVRAMDQIENLPLQLYWDGETAMDCEGHEIKFSFKKERIDQRLSSDAQRCITERLAESTSGKVLLELRQVGKSVVQCCVMHFAYELAYDNEQHKITLKVGRMRPGLIVKVMRLDQSELECLEKIVDTDHASWTVGPRFGVWCAVIYEGNLVCSKPLFFEVKSRPGGTMAALFNRVDERLACKPSLFDAALLGKGVDELIQRIAKNLRDSDWANFWRLLATAKSVETAQFDPLKYFLMNTEFLCVALFQATRDQREALFTMLETLPICIQGLPIDQLKSALQLWLKSLESAGLPNQLIETLFMEHTKSTTGDHGYWSSLCGLLFEATPFSIAAQTSQVKLLRAAPTVLDGLVSELQSRHSENSEWPKTPDLERKLRIIHAGVLSCCPKLWQDLNAPLRTGRLAPFAIAHCAFNGIALTPAMRIEVRKLKAFDGDWFQAAYAIALTLYFAQGTNRE